MLENNQPLLQLKNQIYSKLTRIEGVVRGTEKGFGFLETNQQKSYFIPPRYMKQVMHGDRIIAILKIDNQREIAKPEKLLEPFLTRFIGRIQIKYKQLSIFIEHPSIKYIYLISCSPANNLKHQLQTGDWVVAEMRHHPLIADHQSFDAEITQFITSDQDHLKPWLVTLARHNLEKDTPIPINILLSKRQDEGLQRRDLTKLPFITIDSSSTTDMDDALYAEERSDGNLCLIIAIADPTAWVKPGSELDNLASNRAFTTYLPNFNVPMLPRFLSEDLCSLRYGVRRPVLVCKIILSKDGTILDDEVEFFTAWIISKARLIYENVSDWLELDHIIGKWQPETEIIAQQLRLLYFIGKLRHRWRKKHALVLKHQKKYYFKFDKLGNVLEIIFEPRRIANLMIEEAMIAANICAGKFLHEKLGFGIYNVHIGFDSVHASQVATLITNYGLIIDPKSITTLEGFCNLHRTLEVLSVPYLDNCIRRHQAGAEIATTPGPHFGLGVKYYATWTSPIRKYGDLINHRLIKAIIKENHIDCPSKSIIQILKERRRLNRSAERDLKYWLYAKILKKYVGTDIKFTAEIMSISKGGLKIQLLENGAPAFIPITYLYSVRKNIIFNIEVGMLQIQETDIWHVSDIIMVKILEIKVEHHKIIACPVINNYYH
ncbi:MAG: exoribonuclease II [Candidatus Dasytiphilus stammeri]